MRTSDDLHVPTEVRVLALPKKFADAANAYLRGEAMAIDPAKLDYSVTFGDGVIARTRVTHEPGRNPRVVTTWTHRGEPTDHASVSTTYTGHRAALVGDVLYTLVVRSDPNVGVPTLRDGDEPRKPASPVTLDDMSYREILAVLQAKLDKETSVAAYDLSRARNATEALSRILLPYSV